MDAAFAAETSDSSENEAFDGRMRKLDPHLFHETPFDIERREYALAEQLKLKNRKWGHREDLTDLSTGKVASCYRMVSGKALLFSEEEDQQAHIWDCAFVLSRYLERALQDMVCGKVVVELGCGLGLPGLVASILGARLVYLTDRNINAVMKQIGNGQFDTSKLVVRKLEWNSQEARIFRTEMASKIDLILLSDCLYSGDSENTLKLVDTITMLAQEGTLVVSCVEIRFRDLKNSTIAQEELFLSCLYKNGFKNLRSVSRSIFDTEFRDENVHLTLFNR